MERDKTDKSFHIILHQDSDSTTDFLGRFILGLTILFSIYGCLWNGLGLSSGSYYLTILTVTGALFCFISCGLPGKWGLLQYAGMILLAVYALAAGQWIIDGWNITLNQVSAGLEVQLGRIFPRYAVGVPESLYPRCAALFLAIPAAIIGLATGWSAKGRLSLLLAFGAVILAAALAGLYVPDAWAVLLTLATAVAFGRKITRRNSFSDRGGMVFWLLGLAGVLLSISLAPALILGDDAAGAESARRKTEERIYSLRYVQDKQILPRGNFSKLGDFIPEEDKRVMTVTMSEPAGLYLRGFVGERYLGDGWTGLPAAKKAERAADFSWLHSRGFYGQNQIALLADVLNMETALIAVSVENEMADSGYRYAPYELKTGAPDEMQIGDADLPAKGLWGEREYEYYMTNRSVADYEELYTRLSQAWREEDEEVMAYLQSENVYREYVYANYLDVPEEAANTIQTLLGGQKLPESGLSFTAAQKTVQEFLAAAVIYNEVPPVYKGEDDFLTFLLNESREGYSVHYATAATLLFRSFGIPACYVEGYYISAEDAAAALEEDNPVVIREAAAHAWVEIYRDGVGFIPFEAVPSDVSSENRSEQDPHNAGGAAEEEETPPEPIDMFAMLLWLLIGILLLATLAFLILIFRRLWLRRRWERLVRNCSPEQAAELWTAYIVRLLEYMGIPYQNGSLYSLKDTITEILGQEAGERFAEVVAVQQQARFSLSPLQEGRQDLARSFADDLVRNLKNYCKWSVRFHMKYFDCII